MGLQYMHFFTALTCNCFGALFNYKYAHVPLLSLVCSFSQTILIALQLHLYYEEKVVCGMVVTLTAVVINREGNYERICLCAQLLQLSLLL